LIGHLPAGERIDDLRALWESLHHRRAAAAPYLDGSSTGSRHFSIRDT